MQFKVLGPLQLVGPEGTRVRLASDAQRRLVSHLVLRANTIVRAEELGDHLGLSPGALRTSVSRLRRVLGSDVLITTPPGYELVTEAIDATRFEQLLACARGTRDAAEARRLLEAALELWRGEPYAEFAHEEWVLGEAIHLSELRAAAVERLAELESGAGAWSEAIARLEVFIPEHPLRERPRLLLMQALAASGRQAEALREFERFRQLLGDETGTLPSPGLVALDHQIAVSTATPAATAEEVRAVERWAHDHGFALVPVDAPV